MTGSKRFTRNNKTQPLFIGRGEKRQNRAAAAVRVAAPASPYNSGSEPVMLDESMY
jgi:hypothetical protein